MTRLLASLIFVLILISSQNTFCQNNDKRSDVYFTEDISPEGVMRLFAYLKDSVHGNGHKSAFW